MRIYEEYFRRHALEIPTVVYCRQSSLILKTKQQYLDRQVPWIVMKIQGQQQGRELNRSPIKYLINIETPVHNGFRKNVNFLRHVSSLKDWNEYEPFILEWSQSVYTASPISKEECTFVIWELFSYIFEDWIQEIDDPRIYKLLQEVIYSKNELAGRSLSLVLSQEFPYAYYVFYKELQSLTDNYADWILPLIS